MVRGRPRSFKSRLVLAMLLLSAAALFSIAQAPVTFSETKEQPQAVETPQETQRNPWVTDHRAKELEFLVRQDCGSCHGRTLKGGLGPDLRPETLAGSDPETLALIVLDGVPDSAMPPWRPLLSEADAQWIARYLLTGDSP